MSSINIIEHALERMKERGISKDEVIKTIRTGKKEPVKLGRIKYLREFNIPLSARRKSYTKKLVIILAEKIRDTIDVISVYSKFY